MNNKVILGAIAVLAVLLIVILIAVSIGLDTPNGEPVDFLNHGLFGSSESESSANSKSDQTSSALEFSSNDGQGGGLLPEINSENTSNKDNTENTSSSSSSVIYISGNENSSVSLSSEPQPDISGENSSESSSNSSSESSSNTDEENDGKMTYEKYIVLSPEDKAEFYNSFSSPEAFFTWLNAAKAEYEANRDEIEVDGEINIGDYINP